MACDGEPQITDEELKSRLINSVWLALSEGKSILLVGNAFLKDNLVMTRDVFIAVT